MLILQEGCSLATWLSQLLSQVMNTRPASTSAVSRRRSTFPRSKNSFKIENSDLTTTVAASESPDGFHQQAAASGIPQQVSARVVNPWLSADMWSNTWKQVRGNESLASVEGTCSTRKRDRDTLPERRTPHVHLEQKAESAVQGKWATQRRTSEAEADMDIRNWEQSFLAIALYETNRDLESQRLEIY